MLGLAVAEAVPEADADPLPDRVPGGVMLLGADDVALGVAPVDNDDVGVVVEVGLFEGVGAARLSIIPVENRWGYGLNTRHATVPRGIAPFAVRLKPGNAMSGSVLSRPKVQPVGTGAAEAGINAVRGCVMSDAV